MPSTEPEVEQPRGEQTIGESVAGREAEVSSGVVEAVPL